MRHLDFDVVCVYLTKGICKCCSLLLFLQDPAYDLGNGAYQEMKAEVTEVPASHLLPEGSHSFKGKVWGFGDADGAALIGQIP